MTVATVPDYFQEQTEEALRQQVQWLVGEVGLDDSFFAQLMRVEPGTFTGWRSSQVSLLPEDEQTLRNFWYMILHLLSFLNCDETRLRKLFQGFFPDQPRSEQVSQLPPWGGSSLRQFLEAGGSQAIDQVDRWVTGFRFGDLHSA